MMFLRMLRLRVLTCCQARLSISWTLVLSVLLKNTCASCSFLRVSRSAFAHSLSVFWSTFLPAALCICSTMCFFSISEWILRLKQSYLVSAAPSSTSTATYLAHALTMQSWISREISSMVGLRGYWSSSTIISSSSTSQAQLGLFSSSLARLGEGGVQALVLEHRHAPTAYHYRFIITRPGKESFVIVINNWPMDGEPDRQSQKNMEKRPSNDYQQHLHMNLDLQKTRELILANKLSITEALLHFAESEALGQAKQALTCLEVQLTMVLFLVEHRKEEDVREKYQRNFGNVMGFLVPPEKCQERMNPVILEGILKQETELNVRLLDQLTQLMGTNDEQMEKVMKKIRIVSSKMNSVADIFPRACIKDPDDLFSFPRSHQRWERLNNGGQVHAVRLAPRAVVSESFRKTQQNVCALSAALSIADQHRIDPDKPLSQKMKQMYSTARRILKVTLDKHEAALEAKLAIAEPREDLTQQMWDLSNHRHFRTFLELNMPSIAFSQPLYLPRHFGHYFQARIKGQSPSLPDVQIPSINSYCQELLRDKPYQQSIRIRINSPHSITKYLPPEEAKLQQQGSWLLSCGGGLFGSNISRPTQLIFHIHGGGFVSMSSFVHQTYIREWANGLQVPIVSVDYGKAPSRPFPCGLKDCFEAYMWVMTVFKRVFQVSPERVIFVGDSAGGNLAAALVSLLVEWKLPRPNGMVLAYPALNLDVEEYTPSLLTALDDLILPHTLLKLCAKAYLCETALSAKTSPLISPILTSPEILAQYPQTSIFVGQRDPFHDDCFRFTERINSAKPNNASLEVIESFHHGFLQLHLRHMPHPLAQEATLRVQNALAAMLAPAQSHNDNKE